MDAMTKGERIRAALKKEDVDRVPISLWFHLPDYDQDPVSLAERSLELNELYGYDFIKMMPFGNYGALDFGLSCKFWCTPSQPAKEIKWGIQKPEDWLKVKPLPGCFGSYGKQLLYTQHLSRLLKEKGSDTPFIQTIFTPLSTAYKLAGPRLLEDMQTHPDYVHQALEAILQTNIDFVKMNIEAGVSGFFLATKCATKDLMSEKDYDEFCTPYDLRLVESYNKETWFNVAHIHGPNTRWEKMEALPVNCISWHSRWVPPTFAEARKMSDKCFLGGIHEKELITMDPKDMHQHLKEAVDETGRKGIILGPGCCAKLDTPEINFYAIRLAAEGL